MKKRKKFEIKIYLNIDLENSDHAAYVLDVKEISNCHGAKGRKQ